MRRGRRETCSPHFLSIASPPLPPLIRRSNQGRRASRPACLPAADLWLDLNGRPQTEKGRTEGEMSQAGWPLIDDQRVEIWQAETFLFRRQRGGGQQSQSD